MRIYFDDDGRVIGTVDGSYAPPGTFIEVPYQDLGDLFDWRVVDGALVRAAAPVIFPILSARQIRSILVLKGIPLASVQAYIEGLPESVEKDLLLIDWEYATEFERDHLAIARVATAFEIPPETVDDWWFEAAAL